MVFLKQTLRLAVFFLFAIPRPGQFANAATCDLKSFTDIGQTVAASSKRAAVKSALIDAHLHQIFTTVDENLAWMALARVADRKFNVIFGDIEFAVLGDINRLTNEKNLVTSLTNKQKELLLTELKALRESLLKNNPDTVKDVIFYSDFKSVRFAIVPKSKPLSAIESRADVAHQIPATVQKELKEIFARVNGEYATYVRASDLDVDGAVENWFRGGIGYTADEANAAARTSRELSTATNGNQMQTFENPEIQKSLNVYRRWAALQRNEIINDPSMQPLLDGQFVKDDVLDIIKKSKNIAKARKRLKAKYGAELSEAQTERIVLYNRMIDSFSPGNHIAERKVASLENAELGGVSADFTGLGARNRGATARALAEAKGLRNAIALARNGEQAVTEAFQKQSADFADIINRYVDGSVLSGDDFVGSAKAVWTPEIKRKLVNEVAELKSPSAQRLAFISDGVAKKERNLLAAHGEAIEKVLREKLEGKIPYQKLEQVVFAVDMFGKSVGQGDVSLIIGEGKLAGLSDKDQAAIRAAFKQAIREFNKIKDNEVPTKTYRAVL